MGALLTLLLLGATLAGFAIMPGLMSDEILEEFEAGGFLGTEGDDKFSGSDGNDLLVGKEGEDTLQGNAGHDWIIGLEDSDQLSGGAGSDVIIGGTGQDNIIGGGGSDFVESANVIDEDALKASLVGARSIADVDFRYDLPNSSDEGDMVDLGPGDDTVVAGGLDTLIGGGGADQFALGDWIEGGEPVDIVDFDEAEDILTFVYDTDGPSPDLTIDRNDLTGMVTISADGEPIAVVRATTPNFSLSNIAVSTYS